MAEEELRSYKELLDDMRSKNQKLQEEVNVWQNQWKGFQSWKESHWEVSVPKPKLVMGHSFSTIIAKLMSEDVDKLYRTYIIVCMVCIVASTLVDIYKRIQEL